MSILDNLIVGGSVVSGLVGGLAVLGVVGGLVVVSLGVTIVGDISDVAGVTVDVIVDGLAAAIGENDGVRSLGVITVASLVVAHIDVGVVVLDGVVEAVVGGGLTFSILKPLNDCYFKD